MGGGCFDDVDAEAGWLGRMNLGGEMGEVVDVRAGATGSSEDNAGGGGDGCSGGFVEVGAGGYLECLVCFTGAGAGAATALSSLSPSSSSSSSSSS